MGDDTIARIQIENLAPASEASPTVGPAGVLTLSESAFLKDHAYNVPGESLLAPRLGFNALLSEQALAIVELLDGTRTLTEIAEQLSRRPGQPLGDIEDVCAAFIADLTSCGLIRGSGTRRRKPVRRLRRRTTFSLEVVQLVLTNRCNMACVYCSNDAPRRDMTAALCDKVVESVISMGVSRVGLTGGEPTLHPRFWQIAEQLSRNGVAVAVNTNGSTLTPTDVERLAGLGVSQVRLSVDSLDEPVLRRLGQRQVTPEHLTALIGCLQDAGLRLSTNTLLVGGINSTKAQAQRLDDALDELGVQDRVFSEVVPVGRGRAYPVGREIFDVADLLARRASTYYPCRQPRGGSAGAHLFAAVEPGAPQTICGVGTHRTSIWPDGRVIPCIFMTDVVAGNMTRRSLADIWESGDALAMFRDARALESPVCRRCVDRPRCRGGCKAKARIYSGSPASPDPWKCALYGHLRRARRIATRMGDRKTVTGTADTTSEGEPELRRSKSHTCRRT